jgi:hypothetical protein
MVSNSAYAGPCAILVLSFLSYFIICCHRLSSHDIALLTVYVACSDWCWRSWPTDGSSWPRLGSLHLSADSIHGSEHVLVGRHR